MADSKQRRAAYLHAMNKIEKLKKLAKQGGYAFIKAQKEYKHSMHNFDFNEGASSFGGDCCDDVSR